jgi:hypothetical protein
MHEAYYKEGIGFLRHHTASVKNDEYVTMAKNRVFLNVAELLPKCKSGYLFENQF